MIRERVLSGTLGIAMVMAALAYAALVVVRRTRRKRFERLVAATAGAKFWWDCAFSILSIDVARCGSDAARRLLRSAKSASLRFLELQLSGASDELAPLVGELRLLEKLSLADCPITDDSLTHVARLTLLESLDLSGTAISDAGLPFLKGLVNLEDLDLGRTKITDAGLNRLAILRPGDLWLYDTQVTPAGIQQLRLRCPLLNIDVGNLDRSQGTLAEKHFRQ